MEMDTLQCVLSTLVDTSIETSGGLVIIKILFLFRASSILPLTDMHTMHHSTFQCSYKVKRYDALGLPILVGVAPCRLHDLAGLKDRVLQTSIRSRGKSYIRQDLGSHKQSQ